MEKYSVPMPKFEEMKKAYSAMELTNGFAKDIILFKNQKFVVVAVLPNENELLAMRCEFLHHYRCDEMYTYSQKARMGLNNPLRHQFYHRLRFECKNQQYIMVGKAIHFLLQKTEIQTTLF